MKKKTIILLTILLLNNFLLLSSFIIINSQAAEEEFEPEYGYAPIIDGDIDRGAKEWENASKETIRLKSESPSDVGIETELWVMQNESDIYISVQFEIEIHSAQEFIAILISESESESDDSFFDAKIVQFFDLGGPNEEVEFKDYYIDNGNFIEDDDENGDGDADIDDNEVIYEFRIPTNESEGEDNEDVNLEFGEEYAFMVLYGENSNYNDISNKKSSIVLIEIQYPPKIEPDIWSIVRFVLLIIGFSAIAILYGFYVYKITLIKKKMRRIKE
ncbi:MAG: hypothetical protein EU539_03645 [Promethearchaeota archaeon]|nr:MAG: hypothetical protein EU539_03645 [Candidatus Lokiarchaeota archaeon]